MARYDVVVIGAGLGGLTAGAILARAGRKVLVIERSNSVGGAASSYKSGDLFVEGSLHETSDPHHPRDPKHDVLIRAGVIDAVKWIPAGAFYEARGGPLDRPFLMPDNFDAARRALTERFPRSPRRHRQLLGEMERIAAAWATSRKARTRSRIRANLALAEAGSAIRDWPLSLSQKLDRVFGDNEAVKCALAANLSYYHDDPATLWWIFFAMAQGSYLQSGGRYRAGRLAAAFQRARPRHQGRRRRGAAAPRRQLRIALDAQGCASTVTHTAKDGSDPQTVEARCGSSATPRPRRSAPLMPADAAEKLTQGYARQTPVDFAVRADARPVEAAARIRRRRLFDAIAAALDDSG